MNCEICKNHIKQQDSLSYTDLKRGLQNATVHQYCAGLHIETYFGKSEISEHLKGSGKIYFSNPCCTCSRVGCAGCERKGLQNA